MSKEIIDCLKCERDIYVKTIIPNENTDFMLSPQILKVSCGITRHTLLMVYIALACMLSLKFLKYLMATS